MASYDVPNISFGGLATGLDTGAIIQALLGVKRVSINRMEVNKSIAQDKITSFNAFQTHLKALESAANDLKNEYEFDLFTTSTSQEGILTATASSGATPGNYSIEVIDLAQFEQEASGNFADKDTTTFGTGVLTLNVAGTVTNITIEEGQDTLQALAEAINASEAEVSASVINDGTGTPYRLVLTGDNTGEANTIAVDASGLVGGDTTLGAFSEIQTASDAHLKLNGLDIQRDSNTITDAVAGITLNLTGTTQAGSPVALTVTRDAAAIKDKIQVFADAYNKVMKFINEQKTYNEDKESGGLLMGESLLTRVQSSLHSILIPDAWDDTPGAPGIQMLAQIGVAFENDGTLKVDAAALESAISENFDEVKNLFIDEDNGLGTMMQSSVYEYTKVDGFIDNTKSSQEKMIDDFEDQILRAEDRLDTYEANLLRKFAALESIMSGLQAQQSFLAYQTGGSY